jgi:hypothetical protein
MAYLAYTIHGVQIIRDEEMEEYKNKSKPLARFPLSEDEARMSISELMLIYPYQPETESK